MDVHIRCQPDQKADYSPPFQLRESLNFSTCADSSINTKENKYFSDVTTVSEGHPYEVLVNLETEK